MPSVIDGQFCCRKDARLTKQSVCQMEWVRPGGDSKAHHLLTSVRASLSLSLSLWEKGNQLRRDIQRCLSKKWKIFYSLIIFSILLCIDWRKREVKIRTGSGPKLTFSETLSIARYGWTAHVWRSPEKWTLAHSNYISSHISGPILTNEMSNESQLDDLKSDHSTFSN